MDFFKIKFSSSSFFLSVATAYVLLFLIFSVVYGGVFLLVSFLFIK